MNSNYLILDVETTTKNRGSPFDRGNKLCYVGLLTACDRSLLLPIEYGGLPYNEHLQTIKQMIESTDLLVGFNIKFDLHWIRRYVPNIKFPTIWDCQLGAFIVSNQSIPYPSLDGVASALDLGSKCGNISSQYWDNGIDTTDIPEEELREYLQQDLTLTKGVYLNQYHKLKDNTLFKLQCNDLLVLEEMEYNGLKYNVDKSNEEVVSIANQISDIDKQLNTIIPMDGINWNSSNHVSSILYGGNLKIPCVLNTERVLKSGVIKQGTKKGFNYIKMPRLVEPLDGSETLPTKNLTDYRLELENYKRTKEGQEPYERVYSVSKESLCACKAKGKAKNIIDLLLRRSEVEKLLTTYFRGIPESMQELGNKEFVYGQFNQCVARTGRLSSSNPNLQNIAKQVKKLFITRYGL